MNGGWRMFENDRRKQDVKVSFDMPDGLPVSSGELALIETYMRAEVLTLIGGCPARGIEELPATRLLLPEA